MDSSGRILAFSLSAKMRSAKSANDFMSILSDFRSRGASGRNSNAPIPRLPINASLSSGLMSAPESWVLLAP